MSLKGICFFCFNLAIALQCNGQDFQFSFHQLSPLEGLSQGTNAFVFQDSRGYIWISSIDGLNRYDGLDVKVYKASKTTGLRGNIITSSFYEDEEANLWFTTYEGVHCYLRNYDQFTYYPLLNAEQDTIRHDYYAFHLGENGKLWVRTGLGENGRLHQFDTNTKQDQIICQLDGNRVTITTDRAGLVTTLVSTAFSSTRSGIEVRSLRHPDQSITYFTQNDSLAQRNCYAAIADQASDLVWLATEKGLVSFDLATKKACYFDSHQGEPIGSIFALNHLNEANLIVSTATAGCLIFNKEFGKFTQSVPYQPDQPFGLQLRNASAFYVDPQENLWVSSYRGGLNYSSLNKRKFRTLETHEGIPVISLYQTKDGRVWSNQESGVVSTFTDDGKFIASYPIITNDPSVPLLKVSFFFEDALGDFWASYGKFLFKWEASRQRFEYRQSLASNVLYLYVTQDQQVLATTYSGVYELSRRDEVFDVQKYELLGSYQAQLITAIYQDKMGRLYLAIDANRLVILGLEDDGCRLIKTIEQIGYAKSFQPQGDTLWVATTNGLLMLNTESLAHEQVAAIPQENYYCVLLDTSDQLWLSCNQGIIRYHPPSSTYKRYNLADGLQDIEYNTNAYLQTTNGYLWMGGNKGLNVFLPAAIKDVEAVPKVQFAELLINDEPYPSTVQIGELNALELPYTRNTISLSARALEYSDPVNNSYQYRLMNYDEDWVASGTNGFIRYPNLPPGQYTLQVKAANSDGIWNEEARELDIFVQTPWWQSWWFYLSVVLAIMGIAYTIFNYRLQQALKLEKIRVKISSDLHDDVGAMLTGLAMQAEVVELTAKEENKPRLHKISELSRSALARMRDTVWAIDSRKDKLENLFFRIQEHAEETLSVKDIGFELEKAPALDQEKKLTANVRQNFYLIAKEAITNAAKHSTADQVFIHFSKWKQGMQMTIRDNGTVKEKNYKTTGLGLSNMTLRAEQMNAQFSIERSNGFKITVSLSKL